MLDYDFSLLFAELLQLREDGVAGPLVDMFEHNGIEYKVTVTEVDEDD